MDIKQATLNDVASVCELADQINTIHHQELPSLFVNPEDMEGSKEFWSNQLEANNSAFLVASVRSETLTY